MGNCLKGSAVDDVGLLNQDGRSDSEQSEYDLPPPYETSSTISYTSSGRIQTTSLSEEEQVKMAKRIGLIQHLPTGIYDGCKKNRECVICMVEYVNGDCLRFLPCMHAYHTECIDDWLMRSFTCPSCMEPVDSALLSTYETS